MTTDFHTIESTVTALHRHFASGATKPRSWRREQLLALRALLTENSAEIQDALARDLGKSALEAHMTEIGITVSAIDYALKNLKKWTAPRRLNVPLSLMPGRASLVREPLGTVLIIAPWNYPVQLLFAPLIGALAAGNTVVLKPSEVAGGVSHLLAQLVPRYLDPRAIALVEGGVEETTELLAQPFDHIFYTGNGQVGRIVARAAAENLTPITLELGGKSPVVVDGTTDVGIAARRIAWAKFLNAGQTCVAPDYVLVLDGVERQLLAELQTAITEFFGADPQASTDYGRIINDRHHQRLMSYLSQGIVEHGGDSNAADRYIQPTLLSPASLESPVMTEEIFGPILPLVAMKNMDQALNFINGRDKPLALYGFVSQENQRRLVAETSSGGLVFGAALVHLSPHDWPFGGVGESGMGAYHGQKSVEIFSHDKVVFTKPLLPDTLRAIYPPYRGFKENIIKKLLA
ncbi:aldehyde dehydrogenase family protein [Rothia endophytica]|uniref:aldehyde dehydrogenase family protein n=1 Tax=Rothia endophytica TaxID=1324766 RepID=UPI001F456904|nr:aldehyde dehydrogenase family protein [Rothia endophytica]